MFHICISWKTQIPKLSLAVISYFYELRDQKWTRWSSETWLIGNIDQHRPSINLNSTHHFPLGLGVISWWRQLFYLLWTIIQIFQANLEIFGVVHWWIPFLYFVIFTLTTCLDQFDKSSSSVTLKRMVAKALLMEQIWGDRSDVRDISAQFTDIAPSKFNPHPAMKATYKSDDDTLYVLHCNKSADIFTYCVQYFLYDVRASICLTRWSFLWNVNRPETFVMKMTLI